MKILLTGSTGFIGSYLLPKLLDSGHDVCCLNRFASNRLIDDIGQKILYADLMDPASIHSAVTYFEPETCIHLAAVSPVGYSYTHPMEVNEVNYMGTIALAEACRDLEGFKQFIFAGTSEAYGIQQTFPITEDSIYYPNSPYSASKSAAIRYLEYLRDAHHFPITIALPFNTYGRINSKHFVVEAFITRMINNPNEIKVGDITPYRDFLFRNDHVNGYLTCLDNPNAIGEKFNFCTGTSVSIQTLLETIADIVGFNGVIYPNSFPPRALDIQRLEGSNEKARILLDWTPKYTLHEGLQQTVKELQNLS